VPAIAGNLIVIATGPDPAFARVSYMGSTRAKARREHKPNGPLFHRCVTLITLANQVIDIAGNWRGFAIRCLTSPPRRNLGRLHSQANWPTGRPMEPVSAEIKRDWLFTPHRHIRRQATALNCCVQHADVAGIMVRRHHDRINRMTDFTAARQAMVDCQVRPSDVTSYAIIEAMLWAPREHFVAKSKHDIAYAGAEIELAPGRKLLEPRTLAKMLEAASVGPGDLVLDLAPGTGYSTAVIARMAEAVIGIEPDADLAKSAQAILADLEVDNAVVSQGDPAAGDSAHGPYDVIFINGAVAALPEALGAQLKEGGRLVALFKQNGVGHIGQCCILTRTGSDLSRRYIFDADAPLIAGFEKAPEFTF